MASSDWSERTLGECAAFYSGGTPSKSNPDFWKGTIPWVSAKDMKSFRLFDVEDRVTREAVEDGSRLVPKDTILLLVRGMTLHNDVPICLTTCDTAFNQDVRALRAVDGVDSLFLAYSLLARKPALLASVDSAGHGTGRLNTDTLKATKLAVPGIDEQKRIAHILGTLDDKIELNRRMNATLEAMARALFQSWFVDFDPVRAKAAGQTPAGMDKATADLFPSEFEDSELGEIPKGWKIGTLGQVLNSTSNGVSVEEMDDSAAYIGLEHMPRRSIALDQWGTAAEVESNKNSFKRGDILFGKLRPYFHKVGIAPIDGVCSTDILVLNPKSPKWFGYAFCICISDTLIAHATALSNGAKMPRTKWPDLRDYKVVLPLEPIAAHFSEQLRPMFDRIIANIHESRTLAALRDALLPKLLSGELRVDVPSTRDN